MEDNFDKYLKQKMDAVSDAPISEHLWNKENTWQKIALGIKPQGKSVSIRWFYAAASVLLVVLIGSLVFYNHLSKQMSQLRAENKRLGEIAINRNNTSGPVEKVLIKTDTVIKELIKKENVQNTLFIHDTVVIVKASEEQLAVNAMPDKDSVSASSTNEPPKKSKLHFVINNEIFVENEKSKVKLIGSKELTQKDPERTKQDASIKFAFN
ncbi:MAG TPA: hypothetical protein PK252_00415 [Bacteroidales bacterium]|nr:hypothetical protein [Bacteroidales bacterium]